MVIHFSTRSKARDFKAKREAHGLPTKLIDAGKDVAKRFSCDVSKVK